MKKLLLLFVLITFNQTNAQQFITNFIMGENLNVSLDFDSENIVITTDNANTYFSGSLIFSDQGGQVRIIPQDNYQIRIKPASKNFKSTLENETGTVIGSRKDNTSRKDNKIQIFPIPTTQYLNISSSLAQIVSYSIYNTSGNLKISKNVSHTQNLQIEVSLFQKGNYIIILEFKNSNPISKYFIKN